MAIVEINFDEGFNIKLGWMVGVGGTIIYSVPKNGEPADDEELIEAMRAGTLKSFDGFRYAPGVQNIVYSPSKPEMQAAWVDIYYMDYGPDFSVVRHEKAGTYFNGICKIGEKTKLIPISDDRQAVEITLVNKSSFPIAANGIAYSIKGRVYPIPQAIDVHEKVVLPQFDVGIDEMVKLCAMENSYPANFFKMDE